MTKELAACTLTLAATKSHHIRSRMHCRNPQMKIKLKFTPTLLLALVWLLVLTSGAAIRLAQKTQVVTSYSGRMELVGGTPKVFGNSNPGATPWDRLTPAFLTPTVLARLRTRHGFKPDW